MLIVLAFLKGLALFAVILLLPVSAMAQATVAGTVLRADENPQPHRGCRHDAEGTGKPIEQR